MRSWRMWIRCAWAVGATAQARQSPCCRDPYARCSRDDQCHVQSGAHKQNTVRTAQTKLKPRPLSGPIDLVPKYIRFQCNVVPRAGMH